MPQALEGIRVLDLTHYIAGPFATRLLADLGADVVKVERPRGGDPARRLGPFFQDIPQGEHSLLFFFLNLNKRSITLDVKTATGRSLLRPLVEWADLVVENFAPGTLASWALSYETLASWNPRVVLVSLSNFGQWGPYRDYQVDDLIAYGMGGPMLMTGIADREPSTIGLYIPLYQAGAVAALAGLMGVTQAELTGRGDWLDVSIFETQVGSQDRRTVALVGYQYTGETFTRRVPAATIASGIKPCQDGYVGFAGFGPRFVSVVAMLGRPELLQDPRWGTVEGRARPEAAEAFDREVFLPWLMQRTMREIWEVAQAHGVIAGPVFTVKEVLEDPVFRARGVWAEIEHPVLGKVCLPGRPFLMDATPWALRRPAPLLGQHNREVFVDMLGLSSSDLVRLRQMGVV
ncbi:MAG: CoA transferase [Dehalococcoidia bacterium]|nr:CoA transferase [Dehalococcoidia bacterium]MDW8119725.1 CoA transferase [Chloroflexota bacterium]